jgi:tRNA-(ms[2]io[6]A)-hydroxylase
MSSEPESLFLDRLVVSGVVEARGCERLQMVTDALTDETLKRTYLDLTRAEARHHALFFRLAGCYFPAERVRARAKALFAAEAELIQTLPLCARVH